ncbi:MAG: hypothetical protein KDK70_15745, partial [Myxococcales bacterium]|nr:hypothetical protein [Myxococcales bacterium]
MNHRAPSLWGACALLLWSSACEVDEPSSVALEDVEAALSAVLGDRLEGVVVERPEVAARGVDLLKRLQEGRTT